MEKKLEIVIGAASARGVYSTHRQQRTNGKKKKQNGFKRTDLLGQTMWLSNLTFKNTTHKYYTHISTNSCYTFSIYTSVLHCCDLICDTYLFKLFIFCVEWNGSFGFSNSTRSRSSVDYLYIWKSRSIFFLEIIAKKNCFASML